MITRSEDANWTVADLEPRSPLLAGMRNRKLSFATSRVLEVTARLLAACASKDEINPLWVCRVLLALGDEFASQYLPAVIKMASIAGVQLPEEPRQLHHGLALREFPRPGEWRPAKPYTSSNEHV